MTEETPFPEDSQETPTNTTTGTPDLLTHEIDQEPQTLIFEATRYTTLNRMIDELLIEFSTQLTKQAIGIIMFKKNWIKAYQLVLSQAMEKSPLFKQSTLAFLNAHQEEIINFMKLQIAKDGWRAKQFFKTLQGDEKEAKKWGFRFGENANDRTANDD